MFLQACLNGSRPPGDHERAAADPGRARARRRARSPRRAPSRCTCTRAAPTAARASSPSTAAPRWRALREAAPKLEISLSTGLWITDGDVERRLACVRGWTELPDCVSLNVSEEGWEDAGGAAARARDRHRDRPLARRPPRPARRRRPGAPLPARARRAAGDGAGDRRRHRRRDRRRARARAHRAARSCTTASTSPPGRCSTPPCAAAREVRIGFEDSYWLPDARRAGSNAELVAAAAERYLSPSG